MIPQMGRDYSDASPRITLITQMIFSEGGILHVHPSDKAICVISVIGGETSE